MQQKELALALGVTRPTISEWEHQKKDPSGDRLQRLSEFFNVSYGAILGYEELPGSTPVLYVDNGADDVSREILNIRELVRREPERKVLFTMATQSNIKDVRRAIAVMKALDEVQRGGHHD